MLKGLTRWVNGIFKSNPAQGEIYNEEQRVSSEYNYTYEQAYREIEVVHRCVEMIINGCADVPYLIMGSGPSKKLNKLLNVRPNVDEDRVRFFRRAFMDFIIEGNAFFYYDKNDTGAMYLLPASNVEIVADPVTFISHYEYGVTFSEPQSYFFGKPTMDSKKQKLVFTPDEIIHIKADNYDSYYRGISRLKSIERLMNVYYALIDFQKQFFENGAVPGMVLQTDNLLSEPVKKRLLEQWSANYSSMLGGARSPAILDGGLEINPFTNTNFKELDFEQSIDRIQQDMAKAMGVPYVLMKSGNNANIASNQRLFYEHTIIPILSLFASAFAQFFGPDVIIEPDKRSINALRPDAKTQATYWATLVNTGIATVNEARKELRLEVMEDGECDKIRIPQNITGSATNPSIGGRDNPQNSNEGKESDG